MIIELKATFYSTWSTVSVEKSDSPLEIESESGKWMYIFPTLHLSTVIDILAFVASFRDFSSRTESSTFFVSSATVFKGTETSNCEYFLE